MSSCFMCKGDMEPKTRTYVATLENAVIIVKNVPALVCNQCGEVFYTLEVMRMLEGIVEQLEGIVEQLEGIIKEVAIVEYTDRVA